MNLIKRTLPLTLFLLVIFLLWKGLSLHPAQIPSPLINKPAPAFELPALLGEKKITNQDFLGHITLVNVWATWCYACAEEHSFLKELAKNPDIVLMGFDYKDDISAAKAWLKKYGNPYQTIAVDPVGNVAIDFGVYGTPETFVIDKKGIIRYKQTGPLDAEVWEQNLKPLIEKLRNETV